MIENIHKSTNIYMKFENIKIEENDCLVDNIEYEADSCPKVWEHYKKVYADKLENYNFNQLYFYNHYKDLKFEKGFYYKENWLNYVDSPIDNGINRLFSLPKNAEMQTYESKTYIKASYRYGGECDFNFNEKKCELFKQIIGEDEDANRRENANKRLEECKKKHHSLINFSLMQAIGNLQGVKGSDPYDRLDVFIKNLDQYFKGDSDYVIKFAKGNKQALEYYLKGFKNIYDYFQTIYFIDDRDFINEIIKQGALPIDNCEHVIRYMNLADEFWERKQKMFEKIYK